MTEEGPRAGEYNRDALDHAWRWFELHARQRLQLVNFFLLSAAFLSSGYAVTLADYPRVSAVLALIGLAMAVFFWLVERRVRALLKAGERAMAKSEQRLARATGIKEIRLVRSVENANTSFPKYSTTITGVYLIFGAAFLSGIVFAVTRCWGS